jgi:ferredoxin-nitrite reductase
MDKLKEALEQRSKKINKIEKIKSTKPAIDIYNKLEDIAKGGLENISSDDSGYFLKCFGLFLKKDGKFMIRVRVPAGQLTDTQTIAIGEISKKYGQNYIDITTRQQIELRYIELKDIPEVLKSLDTVGISTFQTGIDNFRNIVTSSFDGFGKYNIIESKPIIDKLQSIFIKKDEWIGTLPRKFNTSIIGTSINDCNAYGHDCCFIVAKKDSIIGFNLYLGGKVSVQAIDTGLFIKPQEVELTFKAIINLFKEYGFRDNRNKNRLYYLLQSVGIDEFIGSIKQYTKLEYQNSGEVLVKENHILNSSGIFKLDDNISAIHFSIPSGIFSGDDMKTIGLLAKDTKSTIRLSVEQSLYLINNNQNISNIEKSDIFQKYNSYNNIYFSHQIACAGTNTCSFGVIPNKPDAIDMSNFLNQEIPIDDGKIRLYWSACPKGCGIHGVADIGFEGCKAKDNDGNLVDGVNIFLGGKATKEAKEAKLIKKAIPLDEARYIVKDIISIYKTNKYTNETFEEFESRFDIEI